MKAFDVIVKCHSCDEPLGNKVSSLLPKDLSKIREDLRRRDQLVRRVPPAMRVLDCRHPDGKCVGVGYDDGSSPTAMCFLCEHQWNLPARSVLAEVLRAAAARLPLLARLARAREFGYGWRACPHCNTAISKNGGCPNMRCAECGGAFRWGLFGVSTEGVVEAHLPPDLRRRPRRGTIR